MVAGGILGLGFMLVLGAGHTAIPHIFTNDPRVLDQAAVMWPWLAGMMPFAGVVFALDGVFFGAGDLRFMRNVTVAAALLAFVPLSLLTSYGDLGLGGLWAGLTAFVLVRLGGGLVRWRGGRWLVAGADTVDQRSMS